jgi:hypothetical protein
MSLSKSMASMPTPRPPKTTMLRAIIRTGHLATNSPYLVKAVDRALLILVNTVLAEHLPPLEQQHMSRFLSAILTAATIKAMQTVNAKDIRVCP